MTPALLTKTDAKLQGYKPFSKPFRLPLEQRLLDSMASNLSAGTRRWCIIDRGPGVVQIGILGSDLVKWDKNAESKSPVKRSASFTGCRNQGMG